MFFNLLPVAGIASIHSFAWVCPCYATMKKNGLVNQRCNLLGFVNIMKVKSVKKKDINSTLLNELGNRIFSHASKTIRARAIQLTAMEKKPLTIGQIRSVLNKMYFDLDNLCELLDTLEIEERKENDR